MITEPIISLVNGLLKELGAFISKYPLLAALAILLILGSRNSMTGRISSDPFARIRLGLARHPVEALRTIFRRIGDLLRAGDAGNFSYLGVPEKLAASVQFAAKAACLSLERAAKTVEKHLEATLRFVSPDEALRPWRIVGAVLGAVLLGAFIYADAAQSLEALSKFYDTDYALPFPSALPFSFLVGSIGTLFTLGLIIIDILGVTHFFPWESQPSSRGTTPVQNDDHKIKKAFDAAGSWLSKRVLRVFALGTSTIAMILTLFCAIGISVYRMTATNQFELDPNAALYIKGWASLSVTLVVIPMYLTTVLLYWGVMGLVVFYSALVGIIAGALRIAWGLAVSTRILIRALNPATILVTRLYLSGVGVLFGVLGLVFGLILFLADQVTGTVELAVEEIIHFFSWVLFIPRKLTDFIFGGCVRLWGWIKEFPKRVADLARRWLGSLPQWVKSLVAIALAMSLVATLVSIVIRIIVWMW